MQPTIQAIVCTVDFSPFSSLVVRYGVALARQSDARLTLLHAVHNPQDGAHPMAVFERGGDLTQQTDESIQRMKALVKDTTVAFDTVVRFGDPVEETVEYVSQLPTSLVISASHGVSGFRRLFIGTVVERLTRALNCPMLVVKPDKMSPKDHFDGFRSMVIGCDRRGHWQQLTRVMPLVQHHSDVGVHLVHAMEAPLAEIWEDLDTGSYGQVQQAHQDRLNRELRDQAIQMFPEAEPLSVLVAPGDPEKMMLKAAEKYAANLIVVGVRHSGKVGRWIAGSTTEGVLRHATGCILTIPETP